MVRTAGAIHGRHNDGESNEAFPLWIATFSTLGALALFFTTSVPAITEFRHLRALQATESRDHLRMEDELRTESLHRIALESDAQAIMLALDRQGIYAGPHDSSADRLHPKRGAQNQQEFGDR